MVTTDLGRAPVRAPGNGSCAHGPRSSDWPLPVLMYHAVSRVEGRLRRLGVPATLLEEQLSALTDAGHALLGLTDAIAAASCGRRDVVALTFDDGYEDFLRLAVPILHKLEAQATLYVPTRFIGRPAAWLGQRQTHVPQVMSRADLAACVASGRVEIGSHSHSHRPLDALASDELISEVDRSRGILEDLLDVRVSSFCYPHGYHSHDVRRVVREAGYDNACEVGRRLRPIAHRWSISRLAVEPSHTAPILCRQLRTGGPAAIPTIKRALQPAWRQVRIARSRMAA